MQKVSTREFASHLEVERKWQFYDYPSIKGILSIHARVFVVNNNSIQQNRYKSTTKVSACSI